MSHTCINKTRNTNSNRDEVFKSYRNDQQDATVWDSLLLHCSLTAQHVSSDVNAHHHEILNCNYSFWFYTRFSLPAAVIQIL